MPFSQTWSLSSFTCSGLCANFHRSKENKRCALSREPGRQRFVLFLPPKRKYYYIGIFPRQPTLSLFTFHRPKPGKSRVLKAHTPFSLGVPVQLFPFFIIIQLRNRQSRKEGEKRKERLDNHDNCTQLWIMEKVRVFHLLILWLPAVISTIQTESKDYSGWHIYFFVVTIWKFRFLQPNSTSPIVGYDWIHFRYSSRLSWSDDPDPGRRHYPLPLE